MDDAERLARVTAERDGAELMQALRLQSDAGYVCWCGDYWLVVIFDEKKRPPLIRWKGWPVTYHIGGGPPQTFAVLAATAPEGE